jgi:hypothetical protein
MLTIRILHHNDLSSAPISPMPVVVGEDSRPKSLYPSKDGRPSIPPATNSASLIFPTR